jgi:hypothetical protein
MICARTVLLLLTAVSVFAPPRGDAQDGTLPPDWRAQTDWSARTGAAPSLAHVRFVATPEGYEATVGPAAIFWRDADTASGAYRVTAVLTQLRNPAHPEAFGIFVGGGDLAGEGQAYTYLLVRPYDGKVSVRRRAGRTARPTALMEWTAHDSVHQAAAVDGRATNELAVEVRGGRVRFLVNGVAVHGAAAGQLDRGGIVGYRVNHNLDVRLGRLAIQRF